MINQTQATGATPAKQHIYGARLRSAREALGIERKEAAAQLRLQEQIIVMIENGEYKSDIPMTFIRGYIRSYSKLLGIPEKELHDAMESLKPKPETVEEGVYQAIPQTHLSLSGSSSLNDQSLPFNTDNIFMKLFTLLLIITLIGLVGAWWHSKSAPRTKLPAENAIIMKQEENSIAPLPAVNPPPIPKPAIKTASKASPNLYPENMLVFSQWAVTDYTTSFLMSLISFLIILTASMRIYVKPAMAGAHSRTRRYPRSRFQNDNISRFVKINIGKIKPSVQIVFSLLVISAAAGGFFWYKHTGKHVVVEKNIRPVVVKQDAMPKENMQIYAPLEVLAIPPTLSGMMMTSITPYAAQDILNQLNDYITQAAAVKFTLTDRSTTIGQFARKKYVRRYRMQQNNASVSPESNNTSIQQNTSFGNGTPPYYYNYNH